MAVCSIIVSFLSQPFNLITLALSLMIVYLAQWWQKHRLMPPGPLCLPLFGKSVEPFKISAILDEMQKKYGDIFTVKLGPREVVILSSMEAIKEVFGKHGDNLTNLPTGYSMFYFVSYGKGNNLFVSEGESWKIQRRFMMTSLKEFGFGKPSMEEAIQAEAEKAVHILRELQGKPIDLMKSGLLGQMAANIISSLICGKLYDYEDETFKKMVQNSNDFMTLLVEAMCGQVERFPFLRYLPDKISGLGPLRRIRDDYYSFMENLVLEQMQDFDRNSIRHMIDAYLKANDERQTNGKETPPFTKLHMLSSLILLFQGGTDDVISLFSLALMLAAENPDAQKKVQEELDRVVGRQRLPSLKDKNNLPYTEAFYLEAQRAGAPFPLTMTHSSIEDVDVLGYKLPAGTHVACNLWSIFQDQKLWDEPDKFRPERFIGEDGKINRMRDNILTFSVGKRICPGQSLASMEIFIFFTSLLQTFTLTLPDGTEHSTKQLEGMRRLTNCNVCAVLRD